MRLGMAVQQEDGRPAPAHAGADRHLVGHDRPQLEAFEHARRRLTGAGGRSYGYVLERLDRAAGVERPVEPGHGSSNSLPRLSLRPGRARIACVARPRRKPAKRAPRVKRVLNVQPSRDQDRDWRMEQAEDAGVVGDQAARIPAAKDLRALWWKVADQGSTGSCVGWSTVDSVLRWHFVKASKLRQDELLSPRFVWMASKETDDLESQPTTFIETAGTTVKSALDVARKFGVVRDNVLPFASGKLYTGDSKSFYAIASRLKINAYFNLSLDRGHTLADWRSWLATKGPIATRLNVDRTWDDATANKGNLDKYRDNTARGGHAVAIVGYTVDRFIVRNSWGTGWGDKGFAYASHDYAMDAFTEAYGVSL